MKVTLKKSGGVPTSPPAMSMPKRFSAPVTTAGLGVGKGNHLAKIKSASHGKSGGAVNC